MRENLSNIHGLRISIFILITTILIVSIGACATDEVLSVAEEITIDESSKSINETTSGDFPQKFSAQGNLIIDALGNEIIFRGFNAIDPLMQVAFEGPELYGTHSEIYYKTMSDWGATIVRIPIHPLVWRDYPEESLEVIDQTIEWIGNQGMYAILDFHSIGFVPTGIYEASVYETTKAEIITFWDTASKRYKDNNIVALYEIFNEPVNFRSKDASDDWDQWKAVAEEIIDIIRANDPDSLIIVGGMDWSYDLSHVIDNPINKENIVYSAHPYPSKTDDMSWEDAFGKVKEKYPVLVTEIGFDDQDSINNLVSEYSQLPTELADEDVSFENPELYIYMETLYGPEGTYQEEVIHYLNQKGIGWVAWNFSPFWIPTLIKNWTYEPTNSGAFFKEQLKSP